MVLRIINPILRLCLFCEYSLGYHLLAILYSSFRSDCLHYLSRLMELRQEPYGPRMQKAKLSMKFLLQTLNQIA